MSGVHTPQDPSFDMVNDGWLRMGREIPRTLISEALPEMRPEFLNK